MKVVNSITSLFKNGLKTMAQKYIQQKSVVVEIFIKTLKNKIYKHMAAVSKNFYFDELNDIVDKYNYTYHQSTKMKPIDVKSNSYVECNVNPNAKDPKLKIGDHVRISKYKNVFAKGYVPNWSEEVFVINKIKNTVPRTYVMMDLYGEEIVRTFYEKEWQKNKSRRIQNGKSN